MYTTVLADHIGQGDVLRDLKFKYAVSDRDTEYVTFDFCVVLTQDCDLEQDANAVKKFAATMTEGYVQPHDEKPPNNDKYLNTILLCPAFVSAQLRSGEHMSRINWKMQALNSGLWSPVANNDNPRYHFLKAAPHIELPELVLDFKRYYTLPREYLYHMTERRIGRLDDLFREAVSQRFAYYLSRVALPAPDELESKKSSVL